MRVRPVTPGKPLIQVVMSHSTLIGADDAPAELVGHGPIPADLAREIAAQGVWRRLVTDPLSGTVLDYGRSTYHPPTGLADHIRARDVPLPVPAVPPPRRRRRTRPHPRLADGGYTSENNLAAYCLHHHKLKTHADWKSRKPTPTAGSRGPPRPGTDTPPPPTTTARDRPTPGERRRPPPRGPTHRGRPSSTSRTPTHRPSEGSVAVG